MIAEAMIVLGGVQIAYMSGGLSAEEAAAPDALGTIVYVHGNLGSYRWFSEAMDIPGARTLALDMPNFGRSDHIAGHSMKEYADYVVRFIEAVTDGPVVLVGHSLGGAVAMGVATTRPELVRGLLLVDSAPINGLVTPEAYHPAIEGYRHDEALLRAALRTVVPTMNNDAWFSELVADARRMKGEAYIGHAVELGTADYAADAARYDGPVLVVRGALDALITAEMAKRTADAFHGEVREYENVGHSLMVEDPARFRALVQEFAASAR